MKRHSIRCIATIVEVFAASFLLRAQPYGLGSRAPIGPFLGGTLPETAPGSMGGWGVVPAFTNFAFDDPVALVAEPRSNRLHIVGRQGTIHFVDNNPATTTRSLLLDLSTVTQGFKDCGLLGLVFHPEFGLAGSSNRGYFYAYYQYTLAPSPDPADTSLGYNRLSRFWIPDGWFAGTLDVSPILASETVLINQADRFLSHNGGAMFFGDDGFLYLTNGDEGAPNDGFSNAQKMNSGLFSGVLRIDVNRNPARSHPIRRQPAPTPGIPAGWPVTFTSNYFIPDDNPWVDPSGSVLEEFWAIGFRSPHHMTFDAVSGRIWLGDVGQIKREEVNLIERGGNYQWAYREGAVGGPKAVPDLVIGVEHPPLHDYGRSAGDGCVIGGYVYRGAAHAEALEGRYVFGDNTSGRIWALTYDGVNDPTVVELFDTGWPANYFGLSSFGVDHAGELFLCKMGRAGSASPGNVYRLVRTGPPPLPPPALLSQTGVFSNLATLAPAPGIIPYDVNSPLWSDGAAKRRWIALPNNGAPYATSESAGYSAAGGWSFPTGTVFIKHFELPVDDTNPQERRPLETRFLVRGSQGGVFGFTYKWRADQSDADLLSERLWEDVVIQTGFGIRTQSWLYPSPDDCLTCHTAGAGHVLGVNTRQLNGDFTYPTTGRTDNQLRTWNHLGMLSPAINESGIGSLQRLVGVNDSTASAEQRVRSYLDANCSHCHRPDGVHAHFDARYETPLALQGFIGGPLNDLLEVEGAEVIVPGHPERSMLFLRDSSRGSIRMPTLARNRVDDDAIATLVEWINIVSVPAGSIPEVGWEVAAVDSYEPIASGTVGFPINVFDNNANTYWTTQWQAASPPPPHEIVIDLGTEHDVNGFRYLPRQDSTNGRIKDWQFYVGLDDTTWGAPAATGTFPAGTALQEVMFSTRRARYVRLRALNELNGRPWTTVAELDVLRPASPPPDLLRVLCLGDSITQGGFGMPSYRDPLIRLLRGENVNGANPAGRAFPTNFVGSLHSTAGATPVPLNSSRPESLGFDPQHEGHFGWTTDELLNGNPSPAAGSGAGSLATWMTGYSPDFVLLHVGTGDAMVYAETGGAGGLPAFTAQIRDEIAAVIDALRSANSDVLVFLAKIIPGDYAGYDEPGLPPDHALLWATATDAINGFIDGLAAAKNLEAGRQYVWVVDMHAGFNPVTMLADAWNPNALGERFLATRWYQAIETFLVALTAPQGVVTSPTGDVTIPPGGSVSFAGSGSDPYSHLPLSYRWNFGEGSGIADATVAVPGSKTFSALGTYVVTFTVTNAQGSPDPSPATRTITVTNSNQPPNGTIVAPAGDVGITVGQSVNFSGSGADLDNHIPLTYLWTFGGGSGLANSATQNPGTRQFNGAGVHTVTFRVSDSLGLADPTPATRVITVAKAVASVSLSNLSHTYDGSPRSAVATTVPAGLAVTLTYDGSVVAPSGIGSYAVHAVVVDVNYQGTADGVLTISDPGALDADALAYVQAVGLSGSAAATINRIVRELKGSYAGAGRINLAGTDYWSALTDAWVFDRGLNAAGAGAIRSLKLAHPITANGAVLDAANGLVCDGVLDRPTANLNTTYASGFTYLAETNAGNPGPSQGGFLVLGVANAGDGERTSNGNAWALKGTSAPALQLYGFNNGTESVNVNPLNGSGTGFRRFWLSASPAAVQWSLGTAGATDTSTRFGSADNNFAPTQARWGWCRLYSAGTTLAQMAVNTRYTALFNRTTTTAERDTLAAILALNINQ